MKGKEVVIVELSPEEAEGIIEEIKRLAERGIDLAYDLPFLDEIRNLLIETLKP